MNGPPPSSLDDALARLRRLSEPVPIPARLPSEAEVDAMEQRLGRAFLAEYRRFLLEAGDVVYGALEPATITEPDAHTHLPEVIAAARGYGLPETLIPFCEDNADFYCLDAEGSVYFWSHEGRAEERWPDLATWIVEVWIGESGS